MTAKFQPNENVKMWASYGYTPEDVLYAKQNGIPLPWDDPNYDPQYYSPEYQKQQIFDPNNFATWPFEMYDAMMNSQQTNTDNNDKWDEIIKLLQSQQNQTIDFKYPEIPNYLLQNNYQEQFDALIDKFPTPQVYNISNNDPSKLINLIDQIYESRTEEGVPVVAPEPIEPPQPKLDAVSMIAYKSKSQRLWSLRKLDITQIIEIYEFIYDQMYNSMLSESIKERSNRYAKI